MKISNILSYSSLVCSILCIICFTGCNNTHAQRQNAAKNSFTNERVEVKATTYVDQFIVRCENGSIWEVKTSTTESLDSNMAEVIYKNCLFDAIYELPKKPIVPPMPPFLPLEKEK